jgi:hypothetical protein
VSLSDQPRLSLYIFVCTNPRELCISAAVINIKFIPNLMCAGGSGFFILQLTLCAPGPCARHKIGRRLVAAAQHLPGESDRSAARAYYTSTHTHLQRAKKMTFTGKDVLPVLPVRRQARGKTFWGTEKQRPVCVSLSLSLSCCAK